VVFPEADPPETPTKIGENIVSSVLSSNETLGDIRN